MGVKQILVDDLDGSELPEDTKPLTVTVDGKKHEVYMSARNTERFMDFLSGTGPLVRGGGASSAASRSTATGRRGGGSTVDTYGFPVAEVRSWAVEQGLKGKSGDPITESTRRINQDIYDAYKAAHS